MVAKKRRQSGEGSASGKYANKSVKFAFKGWISSSILIIMGTIMAANSV